MSVTFISYYTENYNEQAANLIESLQQLGISIKHVCLRNSLKSWQKNCEQKAVFILEKLQELDDAVIWLDADATVVREPILFETIKTPFAAYYLDTNELLSGTMYFKNIPETITLVEQWIEKMKQPREQDRYANQFPWSNDQRVLQEVLEDAGMSIEKLPSDYCCIYDHTTCDKSKAVIIQHQASRQLKQIANTEI